MESYKYTLTPGDLADAQNFLTAFLKERVPEGNYEEGSAVRDIMITGFAALYAFLRGEVDRATAKQSLLRIQEEFTDADDIKQSVNELLSNWFVYRKAGTYATVYGRLHLQSRMTRTIPASAQFWKTSSLLFVPDTAASTYVITENLQFPVYDSRGRLTEYVADIPLRATQPGSAYRVSPGKFLQVTASSGLSDLLYAETVEEATGGGDVESTEQLIARTDTVVTTRNLINNRSCDTTLQNEFTALEETMTIGMGEPEMVRDIPRELGAHLNFHLGGCYDTYVTLPLVSNTEVCTVGGYYSRADGLINIFRDPGLTRDGSTFTSLGVKVGHVLNIRSGIAGSPQAYVIASVSDHELTVSENAPFQEVTENTVTDLEYSIGWLSPDFAEINFGTMLDPEWTRIASVYSGAPEIAFGASNQICQPGKVVLTGGPVLDVRWVELTDPVPTSTLVDPATRRIVFRTRVNGTPVNTEGLGPEETQYSIAVTNPEKAQSMAAVVELDVGSNTNLEGKTLQVTYDTLQDFPAIHRYVVNQSQRVVTANHLIRARNPVWLTCNVEYKVREGATFDTDTAAAALAEFINAFDDYNTFDASDITAFLRNTYQELTTVYPLTVYFTFNAPDGQQVQLSTTDLVSIFPTTANGVELLNGSDLDTPAELLANGKVTSPHLNTTIALTAWYNWMGVTDRTTSYRTRADLITFELRRD